MSAGAAPTPEPPQRTIGEILLAHGYVDQEQLDRALDRQRETGFPLGQILVEAGAITRLELASALAVQWSDMPIAVGDDRHESLSSSDGGERKARLAPAADSAWQQELSTSVRALSNRLEHVEASLVDLTSTDKAEADGDDLRARLEASEALLAETSRRAAEGLTSSDLDERLGTIVAALETSLARADALESSVPPIETRLDEVATRAEGTAAELERRAAHVMEAVNALGQRVESGVVTGALSAQVGELARRIEAVPAAAQLEELNRIVTSLSDRPAADPVLAARMEELRHRIDELEAAPGDVAGLDELRDRVAALPDTAALNELRRAVVALGERPADDRLLVARVDELSGRVTALAQATPYDELSARIDELSRRPAPDARLAERVDRLEAHLADPIEDPIATTVGALAARLEAAESRVEQLADAHQQPQSQPQELDARLAALAATNEALTQQLADAAQEWSTEHNTLERRLAELGSRVDRTGTVAGQPESALPSATTVPGAAPADGHAGDDLNRLWFAVERISLQLTEHHRDIDRLLAGGGANTRLDELVTRLDELEDRGVAPQWPEPGAPSEGAEAAGEAGGPGARALARKLDELQRGVKSEREKLLTQIEQMMGSLEWRLQRIESADSAAPPLGS